MNFKKIFRKSMILLTVLPSLSLLNAYTPHNLIAQRFGDFQNMREEREGERQGNQGERQTNRGDNQNRGEENRGERGRGR